MRDEHRTFGGLAVAAAMSERAGTDHHSRLGFIEVLAGIMLEEPSVQRRAAAVAVYAEAIRDLAASGVDLAVSDTGSVSFGPGVFQAAKPPEDRGDSDA